MTDKQRVLTIAAASGRVGYVFLENMSVLTWGLSRKASRGEAEAAACAAAWIEQLRPDVVVTERVLPRSRKAPLTRAVIGAIATVAERADLLHLSVARWQGYPSKFAEAEALARDHPELAHLVPKPRQPWDTEPRTTVYFEALALAHGALGDPGLGQAEAR